MDIVRTLYEDLHRKYKITKYDYSRQWLKKSKGYLAHIDSTNNCPSLEVLLALYGQAIRQRQVWEKGEQDSCGSEKAIYTQNTDYFKNIEHQLEREIRKQALTM